MRILDKYILRQYVSSYLIILFSFSIIFIVVDVFDNLPRILRYSSEFGIIVQYFLLRMPYLFVLTSPIVVLLAGLFLMNNLSKYNESIATRAAGISIFRMVVPLLILGLFISILITFFGEYILPKAENKREKIYNINIRKREVEDIKLRPNIYYSDDKFMYYIGFFDGYTNKMRVVDITERDENNRIKRKIMANDAVWDFDHWVFHAVHERHFENGELTTYIFEDEHILPDISVEPKDFVKSAKKPMEMNYFELKEYVQRLKKIDEKHTKEETDLHFKLSFPLANFIILLFCVPLASASIRSKGRGVIFLLGIVICVIYLMLLRICQSLGYNQIISPLVAAWLPHLFFLFVGAIVVYKSEI